MTDPSRIKELEYSNQFKRDLRLARKRGDKIELLNEIVEKLRKGEALPERHQDHALSGEWQDCRDCHILSDWLLIYVDYGDCIFLVRLGSHADIFGN